MHLIITILIRDPYANLMNIFRFEHFVACKKDIDRVNADASIPYQAEVNFLSVLTDEEIKQHLGFNASAVSPANDEDLVTIEERDLEAGSVRDFRSGLVEVKNQGRCGSCWTFGAVSALEGAMMMLTGKPVGVSEQEYLDCSSSGRDGCKGGWMSWCYTYSIKYNRIGYDSDIKYKGTSSTSGCNGYRRRKNAFRDYGLTLSKDERFGKSTNAQLLTKASESVISIAIAVIGGFQSYKSGVYTDPACKTAQVNHAVTIVGYGTEKGRKYWLVRNSWGTHWGDKGYIKMDRDTENFCKLGDYAHRPLLSCQGTMCNKQDPEKFVPDGSDDSDDGEDDSDDMGCYDAVVKGSILKGKMKKYASEAEAMDACNKDENCTGYFKKGKKFFTAKKTKTKATKSKHWLKTKCECPSGTIKCPDGKCKHEHMC